MPNPATTRWNDRLATANPIRFSIRLGRMLLLLVLLELLTMPITQLLWTWDGFLHGGQDFELGLFVIVSCLCLVLLGAQHCRQRVRLLLAVCRFRLGAMIGQGRLWLAGEPFSASATFSPPLASLARPFSQLRI